MAAPTEDRASQLIFTPNVIENASITNTKFLSACFAGAAAGILGMENWIGFVLFFISTLFTSAMIYGINCKGRPKKYFQGGLMELMNPGQDNAFTFVLVWTLFYGVVHGDFLFFGLSNTYFCQPCMGLDPRASN